MKRFLALLLSSCLVLSIVLCHDGFSPAHAATMAELESRISSLEEEIKAGKEKLSELAKKKESQQEYLDALNAQIDVVEEKADALDTQIQAIDQEILGYDNQIKQFKNEILVLEDEVALATQQILESKQNIENSKDRLSSKLRASYITGNQTAIKILMGADSLAGFLTRLEMMRRMSEKDREVIEAFRTQVQQLRDARATLQRKQGELEEKKASVESTRKSVVEKKKELSEKQKDFQTTITQLEADYKKAQDYVAQLDKDSEAYLSYQRKLEQEHVQADKELDELVRSLTTTTLPPTTTAPTAPNVANGDPSVPNIANGDPRDYTTTTAAPVLPSNEGWAWPLGTISCYITSGFGNRSASISGWSFHGGIDISAAGVYGKPIYATRSGYVAAAIWGTTGYGRYVLIDHGDGFTSIYGHCSNLVVTEGQYVNQGQQIANVGSTGNSTGPHLHFEIRDNGVKKNPLNYVTKP
ncbi:MAG: peptidoglycan DD-metalloendopeptidase family protein [Clostridia bacterium]|nr:peptidoglycan DD-metalloendopeptidase family protein [Clostridia bacterium]